MSVRPKTITELAQLDCRPCKGIPPMDRTEAAKYLAILPDWTLSEDKIEKQYRFKTYLDGLSFVNKIGHLAEEQDHHPEILVGWRRVKLTFTTHSIKGLSENDFIMAAKAENKYRLTTRKPDDLSAKQKREDRETMSL